MDLGKSITSIMTEFESYAIRLIFKYLYYFTFYVYVFYVEEVYFCWIASGSQKLKIPKTIGKYEISFWESNKSGQNRSSGHESLKTAVRLLLLDYKDL